MPEGRQRFKFLIAGFADSTVRILSLDSETCFDRVSMQGSLPGMPVSLAIIELNDQLHLHIGLENGVLLRTIVDKITGGMSDSRQKFLGLGKVELAKVSV